MITDAMVDAAVAAWENRYDADCDPGERWRDNRYHAMRAALSAALPAAWQDIETAPRDGTEFDAWVQRTPERPLGPEGRVCNVKWLRATSWAYRPTTGIAWYAVLDGKVTHWMPLPAPPADGGGR